MIGEQTFLDTPLKEIQLKVQKFNKPQKISNGSERSGIQSDSEEHTLSRNPPVKSATKENDLMSLNSEGCDEKRGYCEDIERVLHSKNVINSLNETHLVQLQSAAGWYPSTENRSLSTIPGNPFNNGFRKSNVHARPEKEKTPNPEVIITTIRPYQTSATAPNVLSLVENDGARTKPKDIPRANKAVKLEVAKPTHQQASIQVVSISALESRQPPDEATDKIANIALHFEKLYEKQPLLSQPFYSKQEIFERIFYGKTVTEIYEILGKRKRSANEEIEQMPLHKKVDQDGVTK
jgi:hypothetical protein